MLAGQVPFNDPSSTAVAIQHLTQPPPPPRELNPNLNQATEAVLLKALSKSPEERYQTGYELLDALAAALPAELSPSTTLTQRMSSPTDSRVERPTQPQPVAVTPTPSTGNRPVYLGVGVSLIVGLVAVCVVLGAVIWWLRGSNQDSEPAPIGQAAPTVPAQTPSDTATAESLGDLSAGEAPTSVAAPATEAPPPAHPTYSFLIAKRGEDSLFVVNLTPAPLPLTLLRLHNKKGDIGGEDWGVSLLDNGACVTAWKAEGKPKRPDVSCNEVGQPLEFAKKERLWGEAFEVYYGEQLLGVCQKNQDTCSFTTASTSNP
jgi:hypothetical protein